MLIYQGSDIMNNKYLFVNWKINDACNYNCNYCFQRHNRTNYIASILDIKITLNIINMSGKEDIDIMFFGGEPSLHNNLIQIFDMTQDILGDKLKQVTLVTNFSQNVDLYNKAFFNLSCNKILYYSVHNNTLHDIKNLDKTIKVDYSFLYHDNFNIKLWDDIGIDARVNKHIVPIRVGKDYNKIDDYSKLKIENIIHKNSTQSYIYKYNNYIWKTNNSTVSYEYSDALFNNKLCFHDCYCFTGYNMLRIENYGVIRGAICYDSPSYKSIYSGFNPFNNKRFKKLIKCSQPLCGCKNNLNIPKFRNKFNKDELNNLENLINL